MIEIEIVVYCVVEDNGDCILEVSDETEPTLSLIPRARVGKEQVAKLASEILRDALVRRLEHQKQQAAE